MPARPAAAQAEELPSVTVSLVAPFTEAVSVTGAEPEALKPSVAHSPRSPMPLATSPSTVALPLRQRRIWSRPAAVIARS